MIKPKVWVYFVLKKLSLYQQQLHNQLNTLFHVHRTTLYVLLWRYIARALVPRNTQKAIFF